MSQQRLVLAVGGSETFAQHGAPLAMICIRILFILAAIPFSLLAALIGLLDSAYGSRSDYGVDFVFFGGLYIYGSIFALNGQMPLPILIFFASVLNLIGALAWVPATQQNGGSIYWLTGSGLTLAWIVAIIVEYRASKKRAATLEATQ